MFSTEDPFQGRVCPELPGASQPPAHLRLGRKNLPGCEASAQHSNYIYSGKKHHAGLRTAHPSEMIAGRAYSEKVDLACRRRSMSCWWESCPSRTSHTARPTNSSSEGSGAFMEGSSTTVPRLDCLHAIRGSLNCCEQGSEWIQETGRHQ